MQFQLLKLNYDDSDTFFPFFFIYLSFFYTLKSSKTTKARNLKFGDMISLLHKVVHLHFWRRYVTWYGADAPNLGTDIQMNITKINFLNGLI